MSTRRTVRVAIVAAGALVALALTGWFGLRPSDPISFHGDHLLTLGNARSYIDGNGFRWNEQLGFPGTRDSMYHVTFYFAQKSIMWVTARLTSSAAVVVYVFYGVGIVLLFATAYWSLRRLGIGADLAWIGGVSFAVTPYVAVRSGMHDMLSIPFSVPLGVLLAVHVAWPELVTRSGARPPLWRDGLSWFLAAAVGMAGLYYAFFTAFFVAVLAVASSIWRRTLTPIVGAAAVCAAVVCVLLLTGPGTGLVDIVSGRVALTQRAAVEQPRYGLVLADAATTFRTWPAAPRAVVAGIDGLGSEGAWGEWPGPVLTTVILAAPLFILWAAYERHALGARAPSTLATVAAVAIVAAVAFSVRGGLGAWFNEWVTPAIRAQNRVTPFLTFLALIMLLSVAEHVRTFVGDRRRWMWACVLGAALFASALPAFGFLHTKQQRFLANAGEQTDRTSIERLLARVSDGGVNVVLQLPVAAWPEVPPIRGVSPYRFELPYILSDADSHVRWSYGLSVRQRAFRQLRQFADSHREEGLAAAASAMGFDAILVDKIAFGADELAVLGTMLAREVPVACVLFEDELRVLWRIVQATGCEP